MSRTHRALFFFCHLAIAVSVAAAWGMMLFRAGNNGLLSTAGLGSLRYFTVLSNLMAGAASLCCAVTALIGRAP